MDNCRVRTAVFCTLILIVVCNAGTNAQEVEDWVLNRIFWISSDGPIAKALNNDQAVTSSSALILDHIAHVEKAILKKSASRKSPNPDDPLRACNAADVNAWNNSVTNLLLVRGWPAPDTSCITDLHGVKTSADEPLFTLDQVYDAVNTRAATLKARVKEVTEGIINNSSWTDPDVDHNVPFRRLSQQCVVDAVGVIRVQNFWYIYTDFTNAPVDQQLADFGRQSLGEYLRVGQDGRFHPLLMSLPIRPQSEDEKRVVANNSTTELASWGGNSLPSSFISIFPNENLAVLDALEGSDLKIQQAEDAMTPSSIAILVLPLGLNLVPISLIAQVSTCTMLVYLVMSDILTVIPLGIKGIELIFIGTARTRAVVVRLASALNGTDSDSSVGELWASECRAQGNVLSTGIVFVVLSITFLVVGVGTELAAKHYVSRRRKKRMQRLLDQSGPSTPRYSPETSSRPSRGSRSRSIRWSGSDRVPEEGEGGIVETDRNV